MLFSHEPSLLTKKWFRKTQLVRIGSPLKVRASKLWYDISDVKNIQTWFCLCVLSVIRQIKHPIILLRSRGLWSSFICPNHEPFAFCPTSTLWLTGQSLGALSIAHQTEGLPGKRLCGPSPYICFFWTVKLKHSLSLITSSSNKRIREEKDGDKERGEKERRRTSDRGRYTSDVLITTPAKPPGSKVTESLGFYHVITNTHTPTHTTWWVGHLINCDKVINVHRQRERVMESQSKHPLQRQPLQTFCSCRLQARRAQSWHFPTDTKQFQGNVN